jgi:hypothetical protein
VTLPFEVTAPTQRPHPLTVMANRNDVFSRFVNWLSASGRDGAAINRQGGSPDLFSRLMNRISG